MAATGQYSKYFKYFENSWKKWLLTACWVFIRLPLLITDLSVQRIIFHSSVPVSLPSFCVLPSEGHQACKSQDGGVRLPVIRILSPSGSQTCEKLYLLTCLNNFSKSWFKYCFVPTQQWVEDNSIYLWEKSQAHRKLVAEPFNYG